MVKNLLSFAALAALATGAVSAAELDLNLNEPLPTNWDEEYGLNSYDPATHTITFDLAWTGMGWGFWEDGDYSAYDTFTIEYEPSTFVVQLFLQYQSDAASNVTVSAAAGATKCTVPLNPEFSNAIGQICIQPSAAGTLTLTRAYFASNDGDTSVLWEGEYTASGWNSGAEIMEMFVKAGDVLAYTATPGNDGGQVLMKNSGWNNLMGSSKFQNTSIINGVIEAVVTEQMVADFGGKFFLQGDGGMTFTKVEKTGTFAGMDGYTVINAGARPLPVEIYATLPEDAEAIVIAFDVKPEWIQVCNSSWASLVDNEGATVLEEGEDGCVMSFPLTAENIEAINANKQFVFNGGGATYKACYVAGDENGIQAVESVEAEGPAVYYNLQGIQIANPVAGQMYIVKQGNKVSKIIK